MNKSVTISRKDKHGQLEEVNATLKWITQSRIAKKYDTCGVEIVKGHPIIAMLDEIS